MAYIHSATAVAVNGMYDGHALHAIHWRKAFRALGLNEGLYGNRFAALAERAIAALPNAREQVRKWGVRKGVLDGIMARVTQRDGRLIELRS